MPTLIRLIVVLLVLAGIAFGAMFALVATVTPREKQVTVRIPARDLVPSAANDPLVRREIDTSRPTTPVETPAVVPAETPAAPADTTGNDDDVVTVQQGVE
jgi:predicted membrane-bound mannosyltransferase